MAAERRSEYAYKENELKMGNMKLLYSFNPDPQLRQTTRWNCFFTDQNRQTIHMKCQSSFSRSNIKLESQGWGPYNIIRAFTKPVLFSYSCIDAKS